jgi:hypothetical protein
MQTRRPCPFGKLRAGRFDSGGTSAQDDKRQLSVGVGSGPEKQIPRCARDDNP